MSSFDVSVVWLTGLENAAQGIARHVGAYLYLDDDGLTLSSPPPGEPPPPGHDWDYYLAVAGQVLRNNFEDLATHGEVSSGEHLREFILADDVGLLIILQPGIATVEAQAGAVWDFDRAWRYLQILSQLGRSVVWCSTDDEIIDAGLDAATARTRYVW